MESPTSSIEQHLPEVVLDRDADGKVVPPLVCKAIVERMGLRALTHVQRLQQTYEKSLRRLLAKSANSTTPAIKSMGRKIAELRAYAHAVESDPGTAPAALPRPARAAGAGRMSARIGKQGAGNADAQGADELAEFLPVVTIERDADGNLIAPEICRSFSQALAAGTMSAAWVAASSGQILRSYESSLKSLLQAGAENVKDDTTFQSLALKVAEMRAYIKALAPAEAVQEAKNSMEMATERAQKVQDELEAMPGKNDDEKRALLSRERTEKFYKQDPFAEDLRKRFRQLTDDCLSYGPPEFDTQVFAPPSENSEDTGAQAESTPQQEHQDPLNTHAETGGGEKSQETSSTERRVPLLRHFISSYLGGPDGFATDLQGGNCLRFTSPELCSLFRNLVREVSDPDRNRGKKWGAVRTSVLLVATYLASASPAEHVKQLKLKSKQREKFNFRAHENDNFDPTRAIIRESTEAITAELQSLEQAMRDSGDYAKLEALCLPESLEETDNASEDGLRQDNPNMLGSHPEFLQLEKVFRQLPHQYPGHTKEQARNFMLYVWTEPPELQQIMDDDHRHMIREYLKMMENAAKAYEMGIFETQVVQAARIRESSHVQPFLLWLLRMSRRVAGPFAQKMRECFHDSERFEYAEAPVKGFLRCVEKVKEKYSHMDKKMPSSAHLLDTVRGLVVCSTVEDMVEAFQIVCDNFDVLRVKNGFAEKEVPYGFRQILINVRFDPKDEAALPAGSAMVCEVQLNLKDYANVKHKIHKFYSILRCEVRQGLVDLLKKAAHPF